jgi:O-antigen/teichoic acid export membrane protein
MKIGERTVNNALYNTVSGMLPLLLSFIFWPYIVSKLGDSSYGVFALIGSVIGYFALLDLGLGTAVVKYVAEYNGQNDHARIKEVIGTALAIFMSAGLLGSLLILAIARVLVTKIMKIPPELTDAAYYSFCAASLGFFVTMLLTLLTAVINGLNRYDISGITMAFMGVFTTIGAVLLLRAGFGLLSLVWLNVAIPLLAAVFYFILIRRLLPGIPLRLTVKLSAMKRLLHFGMYTMLSRITDVVARQVDLLIIGAVLGVTSVTYYVIPFTILNRLTGLLGRVGMVIFPAISELQGNQQHDTIRDLYLTSSRMILSFATAMTVPLLIFGPRFLHLWMSPEFAERGGVVFLLITISVYINQCTNVPTFVVNGLGKPKLSGLAAISNAAVFLSLMVPGAIYGGIIGVAAAYAVSAVTTGPAFIWYVNRKVVGLSTPYLLKEAYLRPVLTGVVVAIILGLVPQIRIQNIFILLTVMGIGMGLYFAIALLFGVYQKRERKVLMDYLIKTGARLRGGRKS